MSTSLLCPACATPATFRRTPIEACPSCGAAYPVALRSAGELALSRELNPRPGLLTIGLYLSAFMGGVMLLALGLAPFDLVSYSINSQPVSGPEFLQRAGVLWSALGIVNLMIAYGLWNERDWTRIAIMFWWLSAAILSVVMAVQAGLSASSSIIQSLIGAAVAAWYLFVRPNVNEYYRFLRRRSPDGDSGD
jgi:hypothetical protein